MRSEFALDMPSPIFPSVDVGRPFPWTRFQVVPPSRDIQMPLPAPPEVRPQVWISNCHVAAKRMRGLFGSMIRSEAPVLSFTKSTFSHDLPPSMVRKIPRSGCGPYAWPSEAT